ncbi:MULTISPECIES: spore coat protein GerQ [Paenibacillus]|uniref:spore coat protein GerQ n=1 Tax=Paenibacillus TaxID=44249 RepID=UPI0022B8E7E9|nr:spore coat protein GerQ [Paenibacillus caseinilyticus]MCZ8522330.1 spore coat protein GerQ [Paenibacillus caseinilyticus]
MYNYRYPIGTGPAGHPGHPAVPGGSPAGHGMPSPMPGSAFPPPGPPGYPVPGVPSAPPAPGQLPIEQSYIENILRLNLGKVATLYMTYENNSQWNAKIFKGRLEAAGRDHIIISDPATGMRYLLLMVNLDYVTFDQELQYAPSFGGGTGLSGR